MSAYVYVVFWPLRVPKDVLPGTCMSVCTRTDTRSLSLDVCIPMNKKYLFVYIHKQAQFCACLHASMYMRGFAG